MTDWTDQITEFQRKWTEQHQKLMSNWFDMLQQASVASTHASWKQAVDLMEQQVNTVLDNEQKSLKTLVEHAQDIENTPRELGEWERQIEQGIDTWTDLQQRVWRLWFDMLRNTVPHEQTSTTLARRWGETVQSFMEMQEQWLSDWKSLAEERGRSSRSKAARKKRQQSSQGDDQAEDGN